MKPIVLVLGDTGMLGHMLKYFFLEKKVYTVLGLNRHRLDLNNFGKLEEQVRKIKPHYVLNCAGIIRPTYEINPGRINVALPHFLVYLGNKYKFKLVHFSTNCVFDSPGPHSESDLPDAENLYGISKFLGEFDSQKHVLIRTSIIGPELKENGTGLFHKFITDEKFDRGFINIFWNGVTTLELAKFLYANLNSLNGILHFYTKNEEKPLGISKYGLLLLIKKSFNLKKDLIPVIAKDFHQSILWGKYYTVKEYEKQINELREWVFSYPTLYYSLYNHFISFK